MAIVKQFLLALENRPGALAAVCTELAAKAVNIEGIYVPDVQGYGTVRLVSDNQETARKVFRALGIQFSEEEALAVGLSHRPGSLGRITRKLAEHRINIDYAYGTIEKGDSRALVIMGVSNLKKAAQLVR